MQKILVTTGGFVTPYCSNSTSGEITLNPHEGERFWFVWWYCLGASNPFIRYGSAYQEWQANRALVRHLYREGMTEAEILSFAMFGTLVEVDGWS